MHNTMSRTLPTKQRTGLARRGGGEPQAGIILRATATKLPGASPLTVEDAVDAAAEVALGGLGVVLIRRGVAAGLGRALLLIAVLAGAMWLCAGLADAITDGAPTQGRAAAHPRKHGALPACLRPAVRGAAAAFPIGHLPLRDGDGSLSPWCPAPSPRLCRCCSHPALSTRTFPRGGTTRSACRRPGWADLRTEVVGLVLLLACVPASLGAVIVRLVRYHDVRRAQMWWFVAGVRRCWCGLVTDTEPAIASLVSAVVIFRPCPGLRGAPHTGRKVAAAGPGRRPTPSQR